jgi:hypothetical protein
LSSFQKFDGLHVQYEHFAVAAFGGQKTGQLQFHTDGGSRQQIGLIAQGKHGYLTIRLPFLPGFHLFRLVLQTPFGNRNARRGVTQRFFLRQSPGNLQLVQNPARNNDGSVRNGGR